MIVGGIIAVIGGVLFLFGFRQHVDSLTRYFFPIGRAPNWHELFYHDVAVDMDAPELCEKIFSGAGGTAGFAPKGYQISLRRSECFTDVAFNTKNPNLCNEVVSVSTLFLDGSKVSKWHCLQNISNPQRAGRIASNGLLSTPLSRILNEMGIDPYAVTKPYSLTQWQASYVSHPTYRSYQQAIKDSEFSTRVNRLPAFGAEPASNGLWAPNRYELFYQMAAIDLNMPSWCGKISPSAYMETKEVRESSTYHPVFYLRSRCLAAIAVNTGDASLCRDVRAIDASQVAQEAKQRLVMLERDSVSPEECVRQTEQMVEMRRNNSWDGGHQAAIPHDSPDDLVAVLRELGYPAAGESPDDFIGMPEVQFSSNVYYATLTREKNHDRNREFVERVKRLPSFRE